MIGYQKGQQNNQVTQTRKQIFKRIKMELQEKPIIGQNSIRIQKKLLRKEEVQSSNSNLEKNMDNSEVSQTSQKIHEIIEQLDQFEEKYELLQKVGEGGNGFVYKCKHKQSSAVYAVKIMKVDEEKKLQLKRNFLFMKELQQENIVAYKGIYFNDKKRLAYLITEYFNYRDLGNVLIQNQDELKSIVTKILKALKYIHQKNICHRDIKPQNILYQPKTGDVKLIDFGISKKTHLRGGRRDMITVTGSFNFLAPEVFIGGGYNEKIDLWALGVTIYKLVTGSTPFESEYLTDTIENIKESKVEYNQNVWKNYNFFLQDFVQRLIKNKFQRMNVNQSIDHLWLKKEIKEKVSKMRCRRFSSFNLAQTSEEKKTNSPFQFQTIPQLENENAQNRPKAKSFNSTSQQLHQKTQSKEQKIKQSNANCRSETDQSEQKFQQSPTKIPKLITFSRRRQSVDFHQDQFYMLSPKKKKQKYSCNSQDIQTVTQFNLKMINH